MSRFVSNVSKMFPKVETGFHQSYQCVVRENRKCFHVSTPVTPGNVKTVGCASTFGNSTRLFKGYLSLYQN